MDFLGLGFGEILLILIVALIVWGPDKLPGIARQVGKTVNSLKQQTSEITTQIKNELEVEEAKKALTMTTEQSHAPPLPAGSAANATTAGATPTAPPAAATESQTSGED